jgi:hypothetical protein
VGCIYGSNVDRINSSALQNVLVLKDGLLIPWRSPLASSSSVRFSLNGAPWRLPRWSPLESYNDILASFNGAPWWPPFKSDDEVRCGFNVAPRRSPLSLSAVTFAWWLRKWFFEPETRRMNPSNTVTWIGGNNLCTSAVGTKWTGSAFIFGHGF